VLQAPAFNGSQGFFTLRERSGELRAESRELKTKVERGELKVRRGKWRAVS
jgi:hypothetical protein